MPKFSTSLLSLLSEYSTKSILSISKTKAVTEAVRSETSFLPISSTFGQRMWHIQNDTLDIPVCRCGKHVKWHKKEYRKFCSSKCAGSSYDTKRKRENTNIKRFGHAYPSQSEDKKNKAKRVWMSKYGKDNPSKVDSVKEKKKRRSQDRFGTDFVFQAESVKEKTKKTCRARYGVDFAAQSESIKERIKHSHIQTRGVDNPFRDPAIQEQIVSTNMERYGVENPSQSSGIQKRKEETNLKRYGVRNPSQSPKVRKKIQKTNLERYGSIEPLSSPEFRAKGEQTNLKRYGDAIPSRTEPIKQKIRETNLERYGVTSTLLDPVVQEKIKKTNIRIFGVDNPWKSPEIRERIKATNLRVFGVENPTQSRDIREKIEQTFLQKYGVCNPFQTEDVKSRIREKNLERYNRHSHSQKHISEESMQLLDDRDWLIHQHHDEQRTSGEIGAILGVVASTVLNYMQKHDIDIRRFSQSAGERDIIEFLRSISDTHIETCIRSIIPPYELDIYLPEHRLAIEYHGLYWHSESQIHDRNYHRKKLDACIKEDVRLVQIFENEWANKEKKQIVMSMLKSILGIEKHVHARDTRIVRLKPEQEQKFFEVYHIQGHTPSNVAYGLVLEKRILSVMSFGKTRPNDGYDWEILRFCSRFGYNVTGGALKLLTHFRERSHGSILAYCDLRWNKCDLYKGLGFSLSHYSDPEYWYFSDGLTLHHHTQFKKRQLQDVLLEFNPDLTEYENMLANGYDRIWDCGNAVYVLDR